MNYEENGKKQAGLIITNVRRYIIKRRSTFLDALYAMQFKAVEDLPTVMSTDGVYIYYSPVHLLDFYASEGMESVAYGILHLCSHCLLGHLPGREQVVDEALYDVLADYKVNKLLSVLWYGKKYSKKYRKIPHNLAVEYSNHPLFVAYKKLNEKEESASKYLKYAPNLYVDNHDLWKCSFQAEMDENGDEKAEGSEGSARSGTKGQQEKQREYVHISSEQRQAMGQWRKLRKKMAMENPDLSSEMPELFESGEEGGGSSWDYEDLDESETDYKVILEEFLKKSMAEVENIDEIDPMWYHFGLDYLEDIPIIEPTEEVDITCEGTLVIAIDTSGSCQYTVCDRFLSELNNMMEELQFMERYQRVVLYQCDADIQEEIVMEQASDWNYMVGSFTLKGGGGTDFRPVFEESEKFEDMVGLIYLSDCEGDFPTEQPEFPTLFLVTEDVNCWFSGYYTVPEWVKTVSFE